MSEAVLVSLIIIQMIFYFFSKKIFDVFGYNKLLAIMIFMGCLAPIPGWLVDKEYLDKNLITVFLSISIWVVMLVVFLIVDRRFRRQRIR
ncbi:hypothetical protein [Vreelandella sp. GE22]